MVCVYSFWRTGPRAHPPDNIIMPEVKRLDEMQISSSLQSPLSAGAFTNISWALGLREHPWKTTALGDSQAERAVGTGWPPRLSQHAPRGCRVAHLAVPLERPLCARHHALCVESQRHRKAVLLQVVTSRKPCPSFLSVLTPFPLANTPRPQHQP